MNTQSITSSIKHISAWFAGGEILDWFYVGMILFLIGGIVVISVFTLAFLLHTFDAVIFISDEDVASGADSFHIAAFQTFAPRFGIAINDLIPLSPQSHPKEQAPLSTPIPSISPLDLSDLTLRILNGTGIPGLANTWKERFETKGLRHVSIGNAPGTNEQGIVITYKPEKKIFLEALREIMRQYTDTLISEQADSALSDDVVIIIGK